ncbi:MAG TPA: carbonic anhydrase [Anaerolineales bacterium]|nr:carbonic anhydrase [Anaerolineales bacterium]
MNSQPFLHPADLALDRLLTGNRRFITGQSIHPGQTPDRRMEIAQGQKPFAMLLGYVDSRVPPEIIFDCGLGDLFVIRTAGQVIDRAVLGSLEFGVVELHIPLLVVLGHARCGAVIATVEALEHNLDPEADIQVLVDAIRPAVAIADEQSGDRIANTVRINIELIIGRLMCSPVLANAVEKGELKIFGAHYALETGLVEILPR